MSKFKFNLKVVLRSPIFLFYLAFLLLSFLLFVIAAVLAFATVQGLRPTAINPFRYFVNAVSVSKRNGLGLRWITA